MRIESNNFSPEMQRSLKNLIILLVDIDMAEENLNWNTSPAVMIQTIITAKEFLDVEINKYSNWKDFKSTEGFISSLDEVYVWELAKAVRKSRPKIELAKLLSPPAEDDFDSSSDDDIFNDGLRRFN